MIKQLTTFRLSSACKRNLVECVDLQKKIDELSDGGAFNWQQHDRTSMLHQAVDFLLDYLRKRLVELQPPSKATCKPHKEPTGFGKARACKLPAKGGKK